VIVLSSEREVVFPKIYMLPKKPESACEFLEVEETKEGFYLARCKVLDRYLTVYQVMKCERFWKTCPYRKFGLQFLKA
jgi:hypothetical protein